MGRCQGGFCGPRVHEIIARELGIPQQDVLKDRAGSYITVSYTHLDVYKRQTQEYGEKKPQLEREHLKLINNAGAKLAVSKGLYYVDLWEVMADENGYLRADLAGSDGLHLSLIHI